MVNYASVQRHIDRGLGIAARKLGQPFSAYRPDALATGDFPTGWHQLATGVAAFRRNIHENKIETTLRVGGTMWYDLIFDAEPYLLGDVFVQTDPAYQAGVSYGIGATELANSFEFQGFALAWHMPVHKPSGARIDRRAYVTRPASIPQTQPDGSLYWEESADNDQRLQLTNGVFALGAPGAPGSLVPIGLSAVARPYTRPEFKPEVPGMATTSWFYAYIPPLPGYTVTEGDAIICEDDSRYWITIPFRQEAGVVGSSVLMQRMTSQAT